MPDRAQIALDLLSSDMERFTQLVEDLLEISRFDAGAVPVSYTHLRAHETVLDLVCRLPLEKNKQQKKKKNNDRILLDHHHPQY